MLADDDVGKVAAATPALIGRAMELFLTRLVRAADALAKQRGDKIKAVAATDPVFDFCKSLLESAPDLADPGERGGGGKAAAPRRKRPAAAGGASKRPPKKKAASHSSEDSETEPDESTPELGGTESEDEEAPAAAPPPPPPPVIVGDAAADDPDVAPAPDLGDGDAGGGGDDFVEFDFDA